MRYVSLKISNSFHRVNRDRLIQQAPETKRNRLEMKITFEFFFVFLTQPDHKKEAVGLNQAHRFFCCSRMDR